MSDLADFVHARTHEQWIRVQAMAGSPKTTTQGDRITLDCGRRDCEAKWAIIKMARQSTSPELDAVLRLLAVPYDKHPEYRSSWKPVPE